MNFADLQIFKTVVEEGGIVKAAQKLHRVPSNITTRIKHLESAVGIPLFHRNRHACTCRRVVNCCWAMPRG